ncbi:response regulator transcription factor [Euzebya tangerina]|uniref:response regulator transcription factor n=1 Tax=Euzebya tangerina TaxID=591198 RepID=UPI001F0C9A97|nr:response regulator transcription factor [Euzebya tangerina]
MRPTVATTGNQSTDEQKVLLVEDDDGIAIPLGAALRGGGYDVHRVATGREALALAHDELAAVVLDLGLPDIDGVEVCRRLHDQLPGVPVLMLTARTSEADVVVGLDAGADDYVTKPFRLAELLARLRALIRRAQAGAGEAELGPVEAQDVRVDLAARRAWRGEEELDLTPKEFDLLGMLVREAGTVVSREDIMREVWDTTWFGSTKTVDMHVSWLRRKLGDDASDPTYISTVRGVGLRFESEAEPSR